MSATTIAVATRTETVCPPPRSRPGHAAVPVSDAAMSVATLNRYLESHLGYRAPGRYRGGWSDAIQTRLTRVKCGDGKGILLPFLTILDRSGPDCVAKR